MLKFFRLIAFFIRIIFFYSTKFKLMNEIFLFPKLIDSQITLKENEFIYSYLSEPFFQNSNYMTVRKIKKIKKN